MCNPDTSAPGKPGATSEPITTGDVPLLDHDDRLIITAQQHEVSPSDAEVSLTVLRPEGIDEPSVLSSFDARRVAVALLHAANLAEGIERL